MNTWSGPISSRNKQVLKNSQKLEYYFSRVVKIVVVVVLRKGDTKPLKILIKVSFPYGLILDGLPTSYLIVHKKIVIVFPLFYLSKSGRIENTLSVQITYL